ncbi:hypothetical protein RhiJN_11241 [Ceratobasidium sp. AG-Ba]|nr:hypothetical protein RhiJN_11241 [Ceratobasidium sp. AG-Ba]
MDKGSSNKAWARLSGLEIVEPTLSARLSTGVSSGPTLSSLRSHANSARSSSPVLVIYTQSSTPFLTRSTKSKPGSDVEGYDNINVWIYWTLELITEPVDTLHGSSVEHPSATIGSSMHIASEPIVHTCPVLPPFRLLDRPPMCRGPSDLVAPQTDSNMGCEHMPPDVHRTHVEPELAGL